jgi:hypothetical protein
MAQWPDPRMRYLPALRQRSTPINGSGARLDELAPERASRAPESSWLQFCRMLSAYFACKVSIYATRFEILC